MRSILPCGGMLKIAWETLFLVHLPACTCYMLRETFAVFSVQIFKVVTIWIISPGLCNATGLSANPSDTHIQRIMDGVARVFFAPGGEEVIPDRL